MEVIKLLGELHYGRKQIQPPSAEIRQFQEQARAVLHFKVQTFDLTEIAFLGNVFGKEISNRGYSCYACAIMPDQVYMLIRRHRDKADDMIRYFQDASRAVLYEASKREAPHPVWTAGPGCKGFVNTRGDFERDIEYIRQNPLKIHWPEQKWEFVKPYNGWLPGYRG